jgi:hypothetical protein
MQYILNNFGYVYGSGNYNSSTYSYTTCTNASGATVSCGSSSGVLTNTGFDILLASTLACVIIFSALMIRFWKRPKKATVPVESDSGDHF